MQPYGGYGQTGPPSAAPNSGVRTSPFGNANAPPTTPFGAPGAMGTPLNAPFGGASSGGIAPPPTVDQMRSAVPPPPTGPTIGGITTGGNPTGVSAPGGAGAGLYPQQEQQRTDASMAAAAQEVEQFNSPPHFIRATVNKMPNSVSAKQNAKVPLGVILQPLAPTPAGMEDVPALNFSTVGSIVRCKSCRTYINPFVQWEQNGRRWSCNVCGFPQMTLDSYFCGLDEMGKRTDRFERPELHRGAVEYIAPGEYMVRPPQPPVFMFVIDVSYRAVVTGMLACVVDSIKEVIQAGRLPGGPRVQIGIITFDSAIHFYNLSPNRSQPQMLVVSDLQDSFLPLADDILVNAGDSEAVILNLLDLLPQIFADTKVNVSCLGSAVKWAFMAMKHIGGKMLVFGACIPSVGDLTLKLTRNMSNREVEQLLPANDGYKELATEITRAQISVELFLAAPEGYIDLASIAPLAKYTGGDVRFYGNFHIQRHGVKLKTELLHVLTRQMGWEAVMRVRVSRGWKITKFYGHLYIRGTGLLVVPNCHSDQTFGIEIDIEENIRPDPVLCIQSALLYTNSDGERRIRVHTWAAVTTQSFSDILGSVDVQATTCMLSHIALAQSVKTSLEDGRSKLQSACMNFVQAGNNCPNAEALQFLPFYIMGMLKSSAFSSFPTPPDTRTFIWSRLESLPLPQVSAFFCPRMFALHNMPDDCGIPGEQGVVTLPPMLNLTAESMTVDGVFLLEDGETILVWVGRSVDADFMQAVFGAPSPEQFDVVTAGFTLGTRGDALSVRLGAILDQIRTERNVPHLDVQVIQQGDPSEMRFFSSLIEDRTIGVQTTYSDFLLRMGYKRPAQHLPQQANAMGGGSSSAGAPAMGVGAAPMGSTSSAGGQPAWGGGAPMGAGVPPMGAGAPPMGAGAPPIGAAAPPPMGAPPMGAPLMGMPPVGGKPPMGGAAPRP